MRREINVSDGAKVSLAPEAAARLADLYRDDTAELAEMVPSLDLSLWPSVAGQDSCP